MDTSGQIYAAADSCRTLFDTLIFNLARKDQERIVFLRSAQTDFNLWCSSIRATSRSKDSLDYRLRNHKDVRSAICNLLSGLKASLAKYERSILDSLEERDVASDSSSSTGSNVSWDAISEEKKSQDGSSDGHIELPDPNPFVAESTLFITTTIDQLARFSLAIRRAGNKFRFERVDKELDENSSEFVQFRNHLIPVILKGYPDADPEALLEERLRRVVDSNRLTAVQQRLIDANILRKHRIEYITNSRGAEHFEQRPVTEGNNGQRNSHEPIDTGGPSVSVAGTTISQKAQVSSTPPRKNQSVHLAPRTATDLDSRADFGRFESHQVKSTVTNLTRVTRTQAYPRSPESGPCPYCADVLILPPTEKRVEREERWKAHVRQDIMPYTCFIQGCTNSPEPPEMFLTSEALINHLIGKHSSTFWVCDFCTSSNDDTGHTVHLTFQSAEAWVEHIDKEHGDLVETHERQILSELNQQTMIGPLSCPLCDKIKTPTIDFTIDNHILEHLHEFALRALPTNRMNDSDEFSSDLQSRGTVSRTREMGNSEESPTLVPINYPTFVPEDITLLLDILLQNVRDIQNLRDFHDWAQDIHWTLSTTADQEFWWAHFSKLQHSITVYQEGNHEADSSINESILENLEDISDELFDCKQKRDPDWVPGQTDDSSGPEVIPYQSNLGGTIWPVHVIQETARLTGRDEILDKLESELIEQRRSLHLGNNSQPQGQLRIVLEGGPGVGKTAIAIELARRLQAGEDCDYAIFWVDASTVASLEKAYQDIWVMIGEPQSPLIDPMHSLVYYLNWEISCPWLMVLDGIKEHTLLHIIFRGFVPSGLNGSLLFTTTDASWFSILGPSPFKTKIEVEDDLSLDELLREHEVQGEPGLFFSLKTVSRIFTRKRVLRQLSFYESIPNPERYVDLICMDETAGRKSPPYIKIFAILTLIGKGSAIREFVDANLSDKTLPFCRYDYPNAKRQQHLFLKDTDTPIEVLRQWAAHERTAFENTQWMLLVPFLELGPGNMAQDYQLSDRDSLPWCKSKSGSSKSAETSIAAGAYGKVYCVDIHRDCHGFQEVLQTIKVDDDRFAVKELLKRDFNDERQFRKELDQLKRFNGLVHDHLVTLLSSVTKGSTPASRQYHFVFPFARYALDDYWRTNHSPSWDKMTVRWVAKQLLGIMGAIEAIHLPKHLHIGTQIAKYGMHGDLKPDNILWFESREDNRGILVISDFGTAEMHSGKSRSNIPNEKIPAVPGYRPPECDIQNGYISRRYDIWTLGCLFLEMVTWLMGGQELLTAFKKERMKTIYVTGAKRDMFYTVKKLEGQTTGAIHLRESIIAKPTEKEWFALEVKPEVKKWIQRLHEDERCPALIHDILDMIENEMLVILSRNGDGNVANEKGRSSSTSLKRKLQEWVSKCEVDDEYCFRGQPYPRRTMQAPVTVVAPLNQEAEDCIEMHRPALLSHSPSHDERGTKSTVVWEDLREEE